MLTKNKKLSPMLLVLLHLPAPSLSTVYWKTISFWISQIYCYPQAKCIMYHISFSYLNIIIIIFINYCLFYYYYYCCCCRCELFPLFSYLILLLFCFSFLFASYYTKNRNYNQAKQKKMFENQNHLFPAHMTHLTPDWPILQCHNTFTGMCDPLKCKQKTATKFLLNHFYYQPLNR